MVRRHRNRAMGRRHRLRNLIMTRRTGLTTAALIHLQAPSRAVIPHRVATHHSRIIRRRVITLRRLGQAIHLQLMATSTGMAVIPRNTRRIRRRQAVAILRQAVAIPRLTPTRRQQAIRRLLIMGHVLRLRMEPIRCSTGAATNSGRIAMDLLRGSRGRQAEAPTPAVGGAAAQAVVARSVGAAAGNASAWFRKTQPQLPRGTIQALVSRWSPTLRSRKSCHA
mmetsp:Transcript_84172/g.234693  ORF Transcript_84172/g.234693 Transcript_84172/m.234693 type:complete len:223 (-) Transcript_84172:1165-1833(-)